MDRSTVFTESASVVFFKVFTISVVPFHTVSVFEFYFLTFFIDVVISANWEKLAETVLVEPADCLHGRHSAKVLLKLSIRIYLIKLIPPCLVFRIVYCCFACLITEIHLLQMNSNAIRGKYFEASHVVPCCSIYLNYSVRDILWMHCTLYIKKLLEGHFAV